MQVLIHKANLVHLEITVRNSGIDLCDSVQIVREANDDLAVMAKIRTRIPFGLGWDRVRRLGYLGAQAKRILLPVIENGAPLSVRVVEIESAHLRSDNNDRISVSVWGKPTDVTPVNADLADNR